MNTNPSSGNSVAYYCNEVNVVNVKAHELACCRRFVGRGVGQLVLGLGYCTEGMYINKFYEVIAGL